MKDTNIHSSYYEKLVEHLFISDVLETAWLNGKIQIEIARAEIDNSGYDLIFECNNIIRHIQLKCSEAGASTANQKVNIKLAEKPSGCVLWIVRNIDTKTSKFTLKYSFFGSEAGGKLPDLLSFKTAHHSRGNAQGEKKERPNIKVIPKGSFEKLSDTKSLLNTLFNLNID
jgi:hypothetical protein